TQERVPAPGQGRRLLPGQEERNTEFITAKGAGISVREKELACWVETILKEPERLEKMRHAAAALARPYASCDAVKIIAENAFNYQVM
ncbi:MAG: hypothetical protein K6U74_21450, partial [Firmicutes bacterium]|nr:hypothetical protein [Bacillota bacterium]